MLEGKYLGKFLTRVVPDGDCWEWDGAHTRGYGLSWDGQKPVYAHRVAYVLWVGPIPDGTVIDHECNNRGCVRPEHLRAVDEHTNILRGQGTSAQHASKARCYKGHPFSPENTYLDKRGRRVCVECRRQNGRERWAARAANPNPCACGCGETTVKGTYHRGHHPNSRKHQF